MGGEFASMEMSSYRVLVENPEGKEPLGKSQA
jgi:hypothetical protein